MRMLFAAMAGLMLVMAPPALSQTNALSEDKSTVLACIEGMQTDEDWGICLGLMFAPCAGEEVGSEGHVACLRSERENWRTVFDQQYLVAIDRLTPNGATELASLIGQWTGYVGNKCNQVAQEKEGGQADAAQYGCEISEIVGVSAELNACLEGLSTAPYCQIQD